MLRDETDRRRDGHRSLRNDLASTSVPTQQASATGAFYQNEVVSSRQLAYSHLKTIEDLRTVNVKGTHPRRSIYIIAGSSSQDRFPPRSPARRRLMPQMWGADRLNPPPDITPERTLNRRQFEPKWKGNKELREMQLRSGILSPGVHIALPIQRSRRARVTEPHSIRVSRSSQCDVQRLAHAS